MMVCVVDSNCGPANVMALLESSDRVGGGDSVRAADSILLAG